MDAFSSKKIGKSKFQLWAVLVSSLLFSGGSSAQSRFFETPQNFNADVQRDWELNFNVPSVLGFHFVRAVAADSSGNIYVTGEGTNTTFGTSVFTVKYDSLGNEVWVAETPNEEGETSNGTSIVVSDSTGNIYVAGYGCYQGSGDDILLIKYDANGVEQWKTRFNGAVSNSDRGWAIAVDREENIYVGGESYTTDGGNDVVVLKYASNGVLLWTSYFDHPNNIDDQFLGLELDGDGNAVVGVLAARGIGHNYFVVKYAASGEEMWNIVENGGSLRHEKGAIAVDRWNNIYLARETNQRIIASRYRSSGEKLWESEFSGGGSVFDAVVDKEGGFYITGDQNGGSFVVVKFDSSGGEAWRYIPFYDPAVRKDGIRIAVDSRKNVYMATNRLDVIHYDSTGKKVWEKELFERDDMGYGKVLQPVALELDKNDDLIVAGGAQGFAKGLPSRLGFGVSKYQVDGARLWNVRFDGLGTTQGLFSPRLAVDKAGNLYLSGSFYTNFGAGHADVGHTLLKYNSNRELLWMRESADSQIQIKGMATDAEDNIILIGYTQDALEHRTYWVLKYDSQGSLLWASQHDEPGLSVLSAFSFDVDPSGSVLLLGSKIPPGQKFDFVTLKYTSDGQLAWARDYDSPNAGHDRHVGIKADSEGNAYVVGNSVSSNDEVTTLKYSAEGDLLWAAQFDTMGLSEAVNFAVDSKNMAYVVIKQRNLQSDREMLTLKYDPNGNRLWDKAFKRTSQDHSDEPNSIDIDSDDNIYVVGSSRSLDERNSDFTTVKYDTAGNELWARHYNGFPNSGDEAVKVVFDENQNVYVAGNVSLGMATVKYSPDGEQQWAERYSSSLKKEDAFYDITVDAQKNVYICAISILRRSLDGRFWTSIPVSPVIKYSQSPDTHVEESPTRPPLRFELHQNYPNPFNPTTTIKFETPNKAYVEIDLLNINGQTLETIFSGEKPAGSHEVIFDSGNYASGAYLYRLRAGSLRIVKKMILAR